MEVLTGQLIGSFILVFIVGRLLFKIYRKIKSDPSMAYSKPRFFCFLGAIAFCILFGYNQFGIEQSAILYGSAGIVALAVDFVIAKFRKEK
jgi:hypothetical protein